MDTGDWLLVVGSVVFGQFALLGIEFLRSQLERKQRRDDQKGDFQKQTLHALQDTLDVLGLEAGTVMVLRERAVTFFGRRKDIRHDDPHAQATLKAMVRMTSLAERVDDKRVRDVVAQIDDALRQAIDATGWDETVQAMERVRMLRRQANARIGELLRSL